MLPGCLRASGAAPLRPLPRRRPVLLLMLRPQRGLRQPMAVTLIAGLVFSTVLTLVVIPVLYRWVVGRSAAKPGVAEG